MELGVKEESIQRELRLLLRRLEELQQQQIKKTLEPQDAKIEMTEEERSAALDLLRRSASAGVHRGRLRALRRGRARSRTSRWAIWPPSRGCCDAPLAVVVQSSSAAGKSSLMEAVLGFVPDEQRSNTRP